MHDSCTRVGRRRHHHHCPNPPRGSGYHAPLDLHSGLTEADAVRINAAIAAGPADSTRGTYASAWRRFERSSAARDMPALPTTPAAVCAYLTEFAGSGVPGGTIEGACAALADKHRSGGYPDPIRSPLRASGKFVADCVALSALHPADRYGRSALTTSA